MMSDHDVHNPDGELVLIYRVADLLKKVTANRTAHARTFDTAMEEFRKQYRDECAAAIAQVDAGAEFQHGTKLVKPVQYLKEYDRAIAMLTMTTAKTIRLTPAIFQQLVCDQWDWSDRFSTSNAAYTTVARIQRKR